VSATPRNAGNLLEFEILLGGTGTLPEINWFSWKIFSLQMTTDAFSRKNLTAVTLSGKL